MDEGFGKNLAGWFWHGVSQGLAVKMSGRAAVLWSLDGKICSQESSLTWLASWCWVLAKGLSSLPHVPLLELRGCPHDVAVASSKVNDDPEEIKAEATVSFTTKA